jgi:hypothetical protein
MYFGKGDLKMGNCDKCQGFDCFDCNDYDWQPPKPTNPVCIFCGKEKETPMPKGTSSQTLYACLDCIKVAGLRKSSNGH